MVIHTAPQVGFGGGNTAKTDEASVAVRRESCGNSRGWHRTVVAGVQQRTIFGDSIPRVALRLSTTSLASCTMRL